MNKLMSMHAVNSTLNEEKLKSFKGKFKRNLHKDIEDILLNFNVAKPRFTYFKNQGVEFNLNYLFGFSDKEYEDFISNYGIYLTRIPSSMLPIGSIDGGDLLCIDNDNGQIYYWFHEEDDWGIKGNKKYPTLISSNLHECLEFLIALETPTKEELERVEKEGKTVYTSDDFDALFSKYLVQK